MRIPVIGTAAAVAAMGIGAAGAQTLPDGVTLERAPSPVVQPSPAPTASAPAPAFRTSTPTVAPTPIPTPRATGTPDPIPTPAPASTAATLRTPQPGAGPIDTGPTPSVPAASSAIPAAAPAAVPSPPVVVATGTNWLLWLALTLAAAAVVGGLVWRRSRRGRADAAPDGPAMPDATEPPAPPLPVDAPPPTAPIAAAPPASSPPVARAGGLITTALRPAIDFALTAHVAGIDTLRATLDYTLRLQNTGRGAAHAVAIETWLFSVGANPSGVLGELAALPDGQSLLDPFTLPAGAVIDVPAQGMVDRDLLAVLTAGERRLFVPMLSTRVRYGDGRGAASVATAAFMVGLERAGQTRLAPLALDRGARTWTTLGVRRFTG